MATSPRSLAPAGAATTGDVPMIDLLIARGARLDVKHKYDGSPLGTAIYCAANFTSSRGDYPNAVRHLIEAGEKPTQEELLFALTNDLDEIAAVLKSYGVTV
jgi:hypothetical protein